MRKSLPLQGLLLIALLLLTPTLAAAQEGEQRRAWNQPVEPFRVAGNIYYVGVSGVTAFLITTPKGHILLDGGFAETVPHIRESITRLGFKLSDVKVLLNSHAHYDHAGGLAELKKQTGAKLMISEADAPFISSGGRGDFAWGDQFAFPPATVDRLLKDKDRVELGGVSMTARLTPGHTKGCTTWTMKVRDGGRELNVVFVGSTSIPGYTLLGNTAYPKIVEDYAHTFALLKTLPCDIFLASHGFFFDLNEKRLRLGKEKGNPFIDPQGYRRFVDETEQAYLKQLGEERRKASAGGSAASPD